MRYGNAPQFCILLGSFIDLQRPLIDLVIRATFNLQVLCQSSQILSGGEFVVDFQYFVIAVLGHDGIGICFVGIARRADGFRGGRNRLFGSCVLLHFLGHGSSLGLGFFLGGGALVRRLFPCLGFFFRILLFFLFPLVVKIFVPKLTPYARFARKTPCAVAEILDHASISDTNAAGLRRLPPHDIRFFGVSLGKETIQKCRFLLPLYRFIGGIARCFFKFRQCHGHIERHGCQCICRSVGIPCFFQQFFQLIGIAIFRVEPTDQGIVTVGLQSHGYSRRNEGSGKLHLVVKSRDSIFEDTFRKLVGGDMYPAFLRPAPADDERQHEYHQPNAQDFQNFVLSLHDESAPQ